MQRKKKHEQEKNINENKIKEEELYNYAYNVEKDPQTKIINEGNEEVYQIRRKKQLNFGEKERGKDGNKQEAPAELIKTADDQCIIKNFDVDFEEESPDLRMLGGIRGIRALKVQREYMPDFDKNDPTQGDNMFARYEKKADMPTNK